MSHFVFPPTLKLLTSWCFKIMACICLTFNLEMNRLNAVTFPTNLCTSHTVLSSAIFESVFTWVGLGYIPLLLTTCLRNFPKDTPNAHLRWLSFIQNFRKIQNTSSAFHMWSCARLLFYHHVFYACFHCFPNQHGKIFCWCMERQSHNLYNKDFYKKNPKNMYKAAS